VGEVAAARGAGDAANPSTAATRPGGRRRTAARPARTTTERSAGRARGARNPRLGRGGRVTSPSADPGQSKRRRLADRLADGFGSGKGILAVVGIGAAEMAWNLIPGLPHFDPPPFILLSFGITLATNILGQLNLMKKNRRDVQVHSQLARSYRTNRDVLRTMVAENARLDRELERRGLVYEGVELWTEEDLAEDLAASTPRQPAGRRTIGDRISDFAGSWPGVFTTIGIGAVEIAWNSIRFLPSFDPFPFFGLNLFMSAATTLLGQQLLRKEQEQDAIDDVNRQADAEINQEEVRQGLAIQEKEQMISQFDERASRAPRRARTRRSPPAAAQSPANQL
jgi:uncharacterized membrane protein